MVTCPFVVTLLAFIIASLLPYFLHQG
jgi:hypothetical protein